MPNQNIIQTGPVSNKDLETMNAHGLDEQLRNEIARDYTAAKFGSAAVYGPSSKEADGKLSDYEREHYNDIMANQQSFLTHTVYGIGQNILTAGVAMGELMLSPITAIAGAVTGNSTWDNIVTETASKIMDWSNKVMPNYEFDNSAWYQNLGSKWQSFLQTLGYTEGFIGGTLLGGAALRGIGILGKAVGIGKSGAGVVQQILGNGITKMLAGSVLSSYAEAEDQTYNDIKQWKDSHNKDLEVEQQQYANYFSQLYEQNKGKEFVQLADGRVVDKALLDYQQNMKDLEDNAKQKQALIDNKGTEMGDKVFGSNMALLLATNMFEVGHLFSGGFRQAKRSFKALEKDGKFYAPTKAIKAKAYAKGIGNAVSEGFQEKAQGSFTTVAGNYYDDVLKRFNEGDSDEAANSTMEWLDNFIGGLHHAISTTENMEDAVMGALTALVGVPTVTKGANRNASIGRNKFFGISGGLYGEIKEANEQIANAKEGVTALNQFYANQDQNSLALRDAIRFDKYSKDAMEAAILNDKFGYENANVMQTMTLINAFDNAGRLQELKDHVHGLENVSDEDIESIIQLTTKKITDENGTESEVGPYIKQTADGKSVRMTNDEVREALNHKAEEINTFIDDYAKQKQALDVATNEELDNKQLETLTWMYAQLRNFDRRSESISSDLQSVIQEAVVHLEAQDRNDDAAEVSKLLVDKAASVKIDDFTKGYEILEDYVKNAPVPYTPDILPKIKDAQRINKSFKDLNDLYTSYITNPKKNKKQNVKEKVKEQVQKFEEKKKYKTLNNAQDLPSFKEAANRFSDEEIDDYLEKNKNNPIAKEYKRYKNLSNAIDTQFDGLNITDATEEDMNLASDILQQHKDQANSYDDLTNSNSDAIQEGALNNAKAADIARMAINNAINNRKNKNNFTSRGKVNEKKETQKQPIQQPVQASSKVGTVKTKPTISKQITQPRTDNTNVGIEDVERLKQQQEEDLLASIADFGAFKISKKEVIKIALEKLKNSLLPADKELNPLYKNNLSKKEIQNIVSDLLVMAGSVKKAMNWIGRELKGNTTETQYNQIYFKNVNAIKQELGELNKNPKKLKETYYDGYTKYNEFTEDSAYKTDETASYYKPRINEFTLDFSSKTNDKEGIKNSYRRWVQKKKSQNPDYNAKNEMTEEEVDSIIKLHKYLDEHNAWKNIKGLKVGDKIRLGKDLSYEDSSEIFMFAQDENGEYTKCVGSVRHGINYKRSGQEHEAFDGLANVEANIANQIEEQRRSGALSLNKNKNKIIYYETSEDNYLIVTSKTKGNFKFSNSFESNQTKSLGELSLTNLDNVYYNTNDGFINRNGVKLKNKVDSETFANIQSSFRKGGAVYLIERSDGSYQPVSIINGKVQESDFTNPEPNSIPGRAKEVIKNIIRHSINLNNQWINKQISPTLKNNADGFTKINDLVAQLKSLLVLPNIRSKTGKLTSIIGIADATQNASLFKPILRTANGIRSYFEDLLPLYTQNVTVEDVEAKIDEVADTMLNDIMANNPNLMYNISSQSLQNEDILNRSFSNLVDSEEHNVSFKTSYYRYNGKEAINTLPSEQTHTKTSVENINGKVKDKQTVTEEEFENTFFGRNNKNSALLDYDDGMTRVATKEAQLIFDKEKEMKWLNRVLPSMSEEGKVMFKEGLINVMNKGAKAYGIYKNGIITLSNQAARGTVYHEAFHAVMDLQLSDEHKAEIFKEAKELYGNLNEEELEERLAEDFRLFMENKEYTSFPKKILNYFKQLLQKILHWNRTSSAIDTLFKNIDKGEVNIKNLTVKYNQPKKYSSLSQQDRYYLEQQGWTEEEFNSLDRDEQEFALKCS